MRRAKMILAVGAAMAVMMTASVAPAMADNNNNNNDRQLDRQDIRLDRALLNQNDGFFFTPFFGEDDSFFNNSCPFWGDTEGIVNQWDCVR